MYRINSWLVGCCCLPLLSLSPAMALQSDRDQPIHLQADRVEINEKQATSVYQGNVHLQQGSLKIDADEVTVQMKQGRLDVIIIKGKPALLEQMPEKQDTPVRSRADYMEYFADEERLLLKSNAEVVQGQNLFRGDHIEYDTRNSMVRAHKDPSSDSRVHAVIQPGEKPLPATPLPDGPKPIP